MTLDLLRSFDGSLELLIGRTGGASRRPVGHALGRLKLHVLRVQRVTHAVQCVVALASEAAHVSTRRPGQAERLGGHLHLL